ncbi:hypothetical protein OUZ56_008462 [Daphnia magna]|uniref:Uncharacterized protein n=1 Tax=Daphnia magna TaxID=35525 RepID=A0ABR0AD42_9CRUS|nr:hypothetical protein OUZ56_008462 [Daphnia magna]
MVDAVIETDDEPHANAKLVEAAEYARLSTSLHDSQKPTHLLVCLSAFDHMRAVAWNVTGLTNWFEPATHSREIGA